MSRLVGYINVIAINSAIELKATIVVASIIRYGLRPFPDRWRRECSVVVARWSVQDGRCGDCRPWIAQRDPHIGVVPRLAFDETVAGLPPETNVLGLIVEDVVALVGRHGQHSMTFALLVTHHGHEQRLARPAGLDQYSPLEQYVVLA